LSLSCSKEKPVLPKYEFKQKELGNMAFSPKSSHNDGNELSDTYGSPSLDETSKEVDTDIRYLKISVADSGVGMSQEELGLLFHR